MTATCVSDSDHQNENSKHLELSGKFILALIQALLRTGYYLPDHPESQKAKSGIYDYFAILSKRTGEITLYIGEDKGKRALLLEGIDDTPIRLSSIMQLGMAETYMPRIIQFLERKELVSLSLKTGLAETEFCQLIDILSEPPSHDLQGTAARDLFVRALAQQKIHNISFIFREDIISTRANLPWRVRMALSRLKKDLHLIPILRNLMDDELHQVKMQVLTDILRPLVIPELAYSFLLHLDLAASYMVSEQDGEQHFFNLVSNNLIMEIAGLFIHDATIKAGFPEHVTAAKKSRLLVEFSRHLGASNDPRAAALLESFFDNGMISFEDLPVHVKNRIEMFKRLGVFLKEPEKFLASFDSMTEPPLYERRAMILVNFIPILMEREQVAESILIIQTIVKHTQEQSERSALAVRYRTEIALSGALELASSLFISASKETRTIIGRLFSLIGPEAIPHVQAILIGSDDPWKSKQAAEILIGMGENAISGLLSSVESNQINRAALPAIVRVISESIPTGQKDHAIKLLLTLVNDSRTEILCEVLAGLGRIGAPGNFDIFKAKADDKDIRVRKVALIGVGRSADRRGAAILVALIDKAEKTGGGEDQELAATAIEALGTLMASCPIVYDTSFACLSSLVERYCARGTWNKLLTGSFVQPECMVRALTESLGRLRGENIQKHLAKLSKHQYPAVAKRATELCNTLCTL